VIVGIQGKILKKEINYCDLLTSGGVIYRIYVSVNCYSALKSDEVLLHTTHIVREDTQALYGFLDLNEQKMFEMLLKINGVGPKVAMAICSTFTPSMFAQIIEQKDIASLKRVPGIGPKSAGVILVQLGSFSIEMTGEGTRTTNRAYEEALMALEALGFKKESVQKTLAKCHSTTTEELVKEALQYFQK